ncbi:MAG: SMP-30/gluconolactonase/LRE family protein, partial [Desulfobacteraceae bacterium]|nr:SMP-30/gluconolactonase/LRE family protein [Desulfobacteraceae bacterium]
MVKNQINFIIRCKPKFSSLCCYALLLALSLGIVLCLGIANSKSADYTPNICLNNTGSEPQCKDCCDCLDAADQRRACRDDCLDKATSSGFSSNTNLIIVDAPSVLGANDDYADATDTGNEQDCKTYCDESDTLSCGDRKYCRDRCNTFFGGASNNNTGGNSNISIDQAIGDEAQMKTIAFTGLAFFTGDKCSDTFLPPGKVSDFFGFQYMRDIAPNGFGHNTEFARRISDNVLSILTGDQVQALVSMANTQAYLIDAYGYKRFILIDAFRRLYEDDLPDGATGLDMSAVSKFTGDLYSIDARISYQRAEVLGNIVTELTDSQKAELAQLKDTFNTLFQTAGPGGTIDDNDWPHADPVDLSGLQTNDGRTLVSTYATQLYSWYLGSVEGDTYFCPERHGTYFGSFYMKDIPALTASTAVTIDTNLTADMGQDFLDTLDSSQKTLVTDLLTLQRENLNNIVATRETISEQLRLFMNGTSVAYNDVQALVRQYGEYEGEMIYHYTTNFVAVGHSLTDAQEQALMSLRTGYYQEFPDYQNDTTTYDCSGAYLYAAKIDNMPQIENTDFLFGISSDNVVADDAEVTLVADGFSFAEGPASDLSGNIFFSDITNDRIYKWSVHSELTVFKENSGGANGLYFDDSGNLLACESSNRRLVALDTFANVTVLADKYNGLQFNEPNDLWVAPDGGVYFTDPVYFGTSAQDGE